MVTRTVSQKEQEDSFVACCTAWPRRLWGAWCSGAAIPRPPHRCRGPGTHRRRHPLDTIKTKMQAQASFARAGALRTLRETLAKEGARGLYRGLLPPLFGSMVFRSLQFSAYTFTYAAVRDNEALCTPQPWLGGMQLRVLLAATVSSTVRSVIETPLEHVKVRKQVGQPWMRAATPAQAMQAPLREVAHMYSGFGVCWARTMALMGSFFVMLDTLGRVAPGLIAAGLPGAFVKGGICATTAWAICWPFELAKSRVQAGAASGSWAAELRQVLRSEGVRGVYRGFGPGAARSIFANGTSMLAFTACQACFQGMDT